MNKKAKKEKKCGMCKKVLTGKPWREQRFMQGECYDGVYRYTHFCLDCEPYNDDAGYH